MTELSFENHIMTQFDEELEEIRTRLMEMGGKVEQQLKNAILSIHEGDSKLAKDVIDQEKFIDQMEKDLDDSCILVIARRQPAASDLRLVMAVTKAVNDLERIGDEAKKIANHSIILSGEDNKKSGYPLTAFARFDAEAAMKTFNQDVKIDLEYKTALRELMTYMMEDPKSITHVINILWVVRSLERIGDHTKNLCEQIVFVVQGKDIRHDSSNNLNSNISVI